MGQIATRESTVCRNFPSLPLKEVDEAASCENKAKGLMDDTFEVIYNTQSAPDKFMSDGHLFSPDAPELSRQHGPDSHIGFFQEEFSMGALGKTGKGKKACTQLIKHNSFHSQIKIFRCSKGSWYSATIGGTCKAAPQFDADEKFDLEEVQHTHPWLITDKFCSENNSHALYGYTNEDVLKYVYTLEIGYLVLLEEDPSGAAIESPFRGDFDTFYDAVETSDWFDWGSFETKYATHEPFSGNTG